MRTQAFLFVASAFLLLHPLDAQNLILNGDFENNSASECQFNVSNVEFTAIMENATGFGPTPSGLGTGEIDVMRDRINGCAWGNPPVSGATKLGLGSGRSAGSYDAFSFDLGSPISAGSKYVISFQVSAVITGFSHGHASVEIGLSNAPRKFGTPLFSGSGSRTGSWSKWERIFEAPINAKYLTVRNEGLKNAWNHLDDFRLHAVPAATCAFRNGTGINPAEYSCTTPPVLGTDWVTDITTNPSTTATALGLALAPAQVSTFAGEILIGLSPAPLFLPGFGTHRVTIPNSGALVGATLATQGFRIDAPSGIPTLVMLNAQDLVFGG